MILEDSAIFKPDLIPIEDQLSPDFRARDRFEHMHTVLRNRICLLDYPPGTKLSEQALAAEFDVSRTPLRRVLAWLEGAGLVRSMHGVGTFVTDVEIEELTQTYKLRLELARLAMQLDAELPDAPLLEEFNALAAHSKELLKEPDARTFARLNMEFFNSLMKITSNVPLKEICERLYYQTARIWLKRAFGSEEHLKNEVYIFDREVEDIVAALNIGDLNAAALVRQAHISMSFTRLKT